MTNEFRQAFPGQLPGTAAGWPMPETRETASGKPAPKSTLRADGSPMPPTDLVAGNSPPPEINIQMERGFVSTGSAAGSPMPNFGRFTPDMSKLKKNRGCSLLGIKIGGRN